MKWSRIILLIQAMLIVMLAFMLWMKDTEHSNRIVVPVEICREAHIERIHWQSSIETSNTDLKLATEKLESDRERVIRNFTAKGLPREDIHFAPIDVVQDEAGENVNYHLTQKIQVNSTAFDRVIKIKEESGELLKFRIQFNTSEPTFVLSNFSLWLRSAVPFLIQEGKTLAMASKDNGLNGDLKLHSWKISPIFQDNFLVCDVRNNNLNSPSLHARIRGTLIFVLR